MFTQEGKKKEILKVGTQGIAAFDLEAMSGKINKGERVTIVGIDNVWPSRGYELLSVSGVHLIECGFDCIIPD